MKLSLLQTQTESKHFVRPRSAYCDAASCSLCQARNQGGSWGFFSPKVIYLPLFGKSRSFTV